MNIRSSLLLVIYNSLVTPEEKAAEKIAIYGYDNAKATDRVAFWKELIAERDNPTIQTNAA